VVDPNPNRPSPPSTLAWLPFATAMLTLAKAIIDLVS
jgi:hypothetical protein